MSWKSFELETCIAFYKEIVETKDTEALRRLCREDLFFLLWYACKRADMRHPWLFARCREVEVNPDGYLDLWSREFYKSTIITFGKTIQDILKNPEITIGIFSHTRPIAKSFLGQIKRELETNTFLQNLFPEVLYKDPAKESPCWSMDNGITVRRKGNPKEATVEAWGLVDGQPVSKHFSCLVYDDVVTRESVYTPEMIAKVTEAWALSLNLAGQDCKKRYIGTRYHQLDTYATIIERKAAIPRIYPATEDGTLDGKPVFLNRETLDKKREEMGSYVYSSQMLQNPAADKAMGFRLEWLEYYDILRKTTAWNTYIFVDPASEKKKKSDYTVLLVIGLAPDNNYYLLDGIRDRLNLTERTDALFSLVRKWSPLLVGYEQYGLQADIEHIRYVQQQEGYRFHIQSLGGAVPKNDRIRRLVPIFESHRFYLPRRLLYITQEGRNADLIQQFINDEYASFPVATHDDMLDCLSRVLDPEVGARFPKKVEPFAIAHPVAETQYNPFGTQPGYNPLELTHV